jgi:mRNA-degrading endonuclease RelE of RelBE toxin-antitoxin system
MSARSTSPPPGACSRAFSASRAPAPATSRRSRETFAGSLRLRLGDYRVLFTLEDDAMRIFGVRHRSEAYRR